LSNFHEVVRLAARAMNMEVILVNRGAAVFCLVAALALLSHHATDARSSGPPVDVPALCSDMTPRHPGRPRNDSPPFAINTSPTCYTAEQAVTGKTFDIFFSLILRPTIWPVK